MGTVQASAERVVPAAPDRVYELVSDYRGARPRLLPDSFTDYQVQDGGRGAGTVVTYTLEAAGRRRPYRLQASEPEAGRVLREVDTASSFAQDWTVEPAGDGARLRIACSWTGAGGVGGFFERMFAPKGVKRLYEQILDRVEREVA